MRGGLRATLAGGGNVPTRDAGHMDAAIYVFEAADAFTSQWT